MSEIADLLQQRAGLSPDQAQQVEQIVIEHFSSKVPAEYQGILSSVLGTGDGQAAGGLGGLLGEASKLFGG